MTKPTMCRFVRLMALAVVPTIALAQENPQQQQQQKPLVGPAIQRIATAAALSTETIGKAALMAVVPRSHPLAMKDKLSVHDLADVDFISFPQGGAHHQVVDRFLRMAGVSVNIKAVVRFSDTAIALASQDMGVALVDELTAMGPIGNDVVIKHIEKAPHFDVSVFWNHKHPRSNNLRKLIDILRSRLREMNGKG